ncbi:TRIM3 [Branchiostoma lanceolatum]|uniref:TRIM3 protein n=1 Tax=Branchiostoma lanceolatum TaxID=7740 RepID=A0A8J9Z8A4_BRALA|nr:TRIM3 [Branchiostoma lanceolatum]
MGSNMESSSSNDAVEYEEDNKPIFGTVGSDIIQPYAVRYKEDDEPIFGTVYSDTIQPYAVRYQEYGDSGKDDAPRRADITAENGQTSSVASDEVDIKPYAVADMSQDEMECRTSSVDINSQARHFLQNTAASNTIDDVLMNPSNNEANPSQLDIEDVQHVPNDALNPNPMYVPNVQPPATCECTRNRVCFVVRIATVIGLCIAGGIFLAFFFRTNASEPGETVVASLTSGKPQCCDSIQPTPTPAFSNSSLREEKYRKTLKKIIFGGKGKEPGKFNNNYGVVVSAINEIFITDAFNGRVQVFSINGTYLRFFPTIVPGEDIMFPYSVAIDVEPGYLWVVGTSAFTHADANVVQYSMDGLPIKKFGLSFRNRVTYPNIAIDVVNNKVIMGVGDTIMLLQPNGSLYRSFKVFNKETDLIGGVTLNSEGNILFTSSYKSINLYSQLGKMLFQFGTFGSRKGELCLPQGICVDNLGRIIVANRGTNRVDMFTSRWEFIRTVAKITNPWGIAIGPDGQLVVTSGCDPIVTIVPRHMVSP